MRNTFKNKLEAILLIIGLTLSFNLYAQIDDCQSACINGTLQTFTKTIPYPEFGVKSGDNIKYTFTYKECNGILYMQSMNWTATVKGFTGAYNVNGYDRVSDVLALVWKFLPNINQVAFPASCFKMSIVKHVFQEGLQLGVDATIVGYCDPGCCIFNKGENSTGGTTSNEIQIQDDNNVNTCTSTECFPFCRGNNP